MLLRTLVTSVLALGLVAQTPPAGAPGAPGQGGPRGPMARAAGEAQAFMAHHLKLTEAQRGQMKAIRAKHQETVKAKQRAAMEARQALHKAAAKPDASAADLKALHQAASDRQFEALMAHRAIREESRAVLTPEQRAEADRMQALAEERRAFRQGRMGKGMKEMKGGPMGGPGGPMGGRRGPGPGGPFQD